MPNQFYRIIEVAGSSQKSIENAIQNAVSRASRTLRQVGWFEVVETRGHVEDGEESGADPLLRQCRQDLRGGRTSSEGAGDRLDSSARQVFLPPGVVVSSCSNCLNKASRFR